MRGKILQRKAVGDDGASRDDDDAIADVDAGRVVGVQLLYIREGNPIPYPGILIDDGVFDHAVLSDAGVVGGLCLIEERA